MTSLCRVADIQIGDDRPLCVIAGPCLLESIDLALDIGATLRDRCHDLGLAYVFKASFDKANRSSASSPRGPGLEKGLDQLHQIRERLGVPVTTDIHEPAQADPVARVVDLLQIPAFLCRQTDLLVAAARAAAQHNRALNIKKGQFMAPAEMIGPLGKVAREGCADTIVTERGTFFGYHRLVNDFIGLGDLLELRVNDRAVPVCFDCTHSTQLPGAAGETTGGRPERGALLARAAVAAGVHAVFIECHPNPPSAMSDASTMLPLSDVPDLLATLAGIRSSVS